MQRKIDRKRQRSAEKRDKERGRDSHMWGKNVGGVEKKIVNKIVR